jgi:hypothetical protein
MLLIELAQKAHDIGFKIYSKGEGIELLPITEKAFNACKNESIKGIPDLFTLTVILNALDKGIK